MRVSVFHTGVAMVLGGVVALGGYTFAPVAFSAVGVRPNVVKAQDRLPIQVDLIDADFKLLFSCETPTGACEDMDGDYSSLFKPHVGVPAADFRTLQILGYPVATG